MEVQGQDTGFERIEQLLLDIARVHKWTGLYAPGHPFLEERVLSLHASLVEQAAREPSGTLLLGVLRDKVMYQDRFFEARHPIVVAFAEELYRHHVATIGFEDSATPEGLSIFFRCLRDLQTGKTEEIPEGYLQREGVRGIFLSPINYEELLSRGIVGREPVEDAGAREEALWRVLLAGQAGDEASERRIAEELSEFPEVLPVILRRARASAPRSGAAATRVALAPGGGAADGGSSGEVVSKEVLQRMFQRIGQTLKSLPEERRKKVLELLEEGMGGDTDFVYGFGEGTESPDLSLARSLSEGYTDSEFLELLAGLLSMEKKGGSVSCDPSRSSPRGGMWKDPWSLSSGAGRGRGVTQRTITRERRGTPSSGCSWGDPKRRTWGTTIRSSSRPCRAVRIGKGKRRRLPRPSTRRWRRSSIRKRCDGKGSSSCWICCSREWRTRSI